MPPQLVSLRFEDLLTATGLMQLKSQAEQIINDPQSSAELVFEQLREQATNQGWRIPVAVRAITNQVEILWTPPAPGNPGADFDITGLLSKLKTLRILINQAGTALDELQMELESELVAFRDAVTQQAAKIPFRISVEDLGGSKQFRVEQDTTMPPPQATFGGLTATLRNSLLTFTSANITALELDAELAFPHMLNAAGTGPATATIRFTHSGNRFTADATNLPVASMNGFAVTLEALHLIAEAGNVLPGSTGNGKISLDFLDPDVSGPAEIDISVAFGSGGMITYEAQNPEGKALRKGPVHMRFSTIRVVTQPSSPTAVTISGLFSLDGVNRPDGTPVETTFDMSYDGTLYQFEGRDFIPAPVGFGTVTLHRARLHIDASSGNVAVSEWLGNISFPWFDQGSLDFEVQFDNTANTLTIHVANHGDTPLAHGDISLVIKPFSMTFRNGSLDDITGNGLLTLPAIAGTQPMEAELLYTKQGSNNTLLIRVQHFHTPKLAGCEIVFAKTEFLFNNGVFSSSNIEGRISLPNVTGGNGVGFLMDITQNGHEITFALNPASAPHILEFGPVLFNIDILDIRILNSQLTSLTGSGTMQLPSVQDPFGASFTYQASSNPPQYEFVITGLKTSVGSFELEVLNFHLTTLAGHPFQVVSDGRLWLPVFTGGTGLAYDFTISNNTTYRIKTTGGADMIAFGGFNLSDADFEIDVSGGVIQSYNGSAKLQIPGLPSAIQMEVQYDRQSKTHRITLTAPLTGIPFFGGSIDIDTFMLELVQSAFSQGSSAGKLKLPGTTGPSGLTYAIAVNNQGDYDLMVSGNNERLNLRVLELEIPTPGFVMEIRSGNLHRANGSGRLIFPGMVPVSPFNVSFDITASGSPVVYAWRVQLTDAEATLAGFRLGFALIDIATDSAGTFTANINGKLHLPVFTDGTGLDFGVEIPGNDTYRIVVSQTTGKVVFGGFELSDVDIALLVTQGVLQDFTGSARMQIPGFNSPVDVAVGYRKQNVAGKQELSIALPAGTPEMPLFGGSIRTEEFALTLLDGQFGSCNGKGTFKLPGAVGSGGINFTFDMADADAGRSYRLQLDSNPTQPAILDFHAIKLQVDSFLLEVQNSRFHRIQAAGGIGISALSDSSLSFTLLAAAPANPADPIDYTITGTGQAGIGGFSLNFANITIHSQAGSFAASAQGQLTLPVFNNGSLAFEVAFSNSGKDYDIVVSNNTQELTFGSFGLTLKGLTLRVRNDKLDHLAITEATLRIPGMTTPVAVNAVYQQRDSQGRESLLIELAAPVSADFAGGNITIHDDFSLLILNGNFESCGASGRFRLPGSTSPSTEGISFSMQIENGGNRFTLQMSGNPQDNLLSFGPVGLEFSSFSLIYDNNRIELVSGSGSLRLPGFNDPVAFSISIDQAGNTQRFRLLVQNADIELSDFRIHFTEIELISAEPDFSFSSSGQVSLPVFDDGQMDFELLVGSGDNYGFNIRGTGTTVTAGPLELSDFMLDMQVSNGGISNAAGSGRIKVADFTPDPVNIGVTYSHDAVANLRDFILHADSVGATFDLNILALTLNLVHIHIRNGALQEGRLAGSVTIPAFSGPAVEFALAYEHTPPAYEVLISSTGPLTAGVLTLNQVRFHYKKLSNGTTQFSGTAELMFPGTTTPAGVTVAYAANRLSFAASNPPPINIGGFSLTFSSIGFALEKNPSTGNTALTDLNFAGIMTIPACEPGFNTLGFLFDMTGSGNQYRIMLNPGAPPTTLKLGPVALSLNTFELSVENGAVKTLSGSAGLKMEGLDNAAGDAPADIAVLFGYDAGASRYTIGLDTPPGGSFDITIGGFTLKIRSLQLNFSATTLQYPFSFSGGLVIPGLQDNQGQPASVDVTVQVNSGGNFTVITASDATFVFGNLKVSEISVAIEKNAGKLRVAVSGKLTIDGLGGESRSIDVDIEIMDDGTFRIKGETTPAIKLLDIPSAIRLYLSMIELSRKSGQWSFAMGGQIQNLIVIPGMDNLLPSELNLRNLHFGDEFDLDLGVKWPSGLSINLGGDGGGDVSVPVNGKFGDAISLDALKISYGNFSAPSVPIKFMFMGATLKLGPVAATVDGLGLGVTLAKRDPYTNPGNFGVVQIDMEFLPPAGLGISLDTPVFTGGGYLFYDKPKGEYAGAVELSFKGMFAISAIAVINSKMPDGQPGTSVLFILSVEFSPGISLGFGFFLSGLGGMIGIHRTMQVEKLREGVRSGTIKNILFPQNIIANISKIISDIKEVFPVKRDQFIIGPMAAITWGVPTIMRLDLGLAIEFASPVRFGILGVLRVILPDEKAALIKIQIAFLGMIDFEKQMLSFDASLFDSKILTFGLEGDMALRLSWGKEKDFVLSVGGFHPSYNPPAHLNIPKMRKLTVKILTGNPRLTLTSYFAVTTNTVQFGAGIDFYFGISKFKIIGEFGFDVLFQFSPFRFIADAYARLAVKLGSATLLGISLEFSLEGPTPWRAKGTAKFTILFITIKVKFDKTWGEKKNTMLPDIAVLPLLLEALNERRNWRSISQAHGVPGVRMKATESSEELILTPNGVIEISQKIVPLNTGISKFGQYNPADFTKFEISQTSIGNASTGPVQYITDVFAPANYLMVNDKEKLQLPSFEKQAAGVQIKGSGDMLKVGAGVNRQVTYEQSLEDKDYQGKLGLNANALLGARESAFMMTHGAIRRSPFSNRKQLFVNNSKVRINAPTYAVVNTDNLTQAGAGYASYMQAYEAMQTSGDDMQIVPVDII
ncbi:MAG: DUF6603 domain-containing protein [Bacteroidales bacterium]